MSERCNCATNPSEHDHRFLRPVTVAALVGRPIQTVLTWQKRGVVPTEGEQYGQRKVCVCCCAEQATKTPVRWVKRTRRVIARRAAA
jgi:hypothetical protein